jgi:hypothetical protein
MRTVLVVLGSMAAVVLSSTAAGAASPREIFEKHGLFGTWAADCARPPSVANPHVVYRLRGADGVERETFIALGKPFDVSVPESVAEAGPDEIMIAWMTGEGGIANRIRLQPGEMQVMDSTRYSGEKLSVNGRRVRDGTETPRFKRCREGV